MRSEIWTWGIIVIGYTLPGVLVGFGLGPAGSAFERWGRSAASLN